MHENYERIAIEKGWQTQDSCKVSFEQLPDKNKATMLIMAELLIDKFKPSDVKTVGEVKTDIKLAAEDFDKRAYYGHFAGEDPSYHFTNGANHVLSKLSQSSSKSEGSESVEKCNSCGSKKVEIIHRCKCGIEW